MRSETAVSGICGDEETRHRFAFGKIYVGGKKTISNQPIIFNITYTPWKEKFEQFVIGIVCQLFGDKATTEKIADEIMRIHERRMSDQSVLQLLERDRDEVTRSLANIMKAIERGIFNETTKARMDELEQRRSEIDDKIAIEQCKHQNRLTKDKVISYLTDPLRQAPRRLIRALIEKIIVFDDKIQIFFKYTKTSPEDNPWEMSSYPGSDSSNMVDLRRILRANRAIFPCLSPCVALVPPSAG